MIDKKSIGGVLTYKLTNLGAHGQIIGADGSGEFSFIIEGTPDEAFEWSREHLFGVLRNKVKIENVTLVLNEEGFSGPFLTVVAAKEAEDAHETP